jgi:hypothetical protein
MCPNIYIPFRKSDFRHEIEKIDYYMFSGFHAWYYLADSFLGCYTVLDNNFVLPLGGNVLPTFQCD